MILTEPRGRPTSARIRARIDVVTSRRIRRLAASLA